jgi:tetratricopeptide (TPR) repeat protein
MALLVAATFLAYQPAWNGKPIWDDAAYMITTPLPTAWAELRRIWFSHDVPSQYFPLTFTTFYVERELWGLNPLGYHLVNILLHAANALLVWQVLRRLRVPGAWLAAAVFALHPAQVESVAWIAERKNVLMGFFFLLTLLAWTKFMDESCRRRWRFYALALIFYLLALLAKTTACTLPAALLLILWLEKMPIGRRRLAQVAPFAAMSLGMGLLTVWWERYHQGTQGEFFDIGPVERVLIASRAVWFYAGKLLWPVNLTFSYPRWAISASDPRAYGWVLATAAAGWVVWRARRRLGRSVEVAAIFFAATLAPVLGFIMLFTFLYSFVADHYQYLACIGPIALAAAGIDTLFHRLGERRLVWEKAFCAILLVTLFVAAWRQSRMYTDMETLWRATIARNPDSWMAQNDLGAVLYEKGQVDEAMVLFRRALAIRPDYAEAQNNLGSALVKKGQVQEGIRRFRRAVALRPDFAEAYRNLGNTLLTAGQADEAILECRKAAFLQPEFPQVHYTLASALVAKGETAQAIVEYQKALALQPDDALVHYNLGIALRQNGQWDQAILEFQKAAALRPGFAEAENNLGNSLLQQRRMEEAAAHLRKALAVHPGYAPALYNLGNALLQQGRMDEAVLEFQKLLAVQPDSLEGRRSLANIAWRLATAPNPAQRNGAKAVELARQTDRLAGGSNPMMAAILAAACAEAGQFNQAVVAARRALQLAGRQDNNRAMIAAIEAQLISYEAGSPFRDPAGAK